MESEFIFRDISHEALKTSNNTLVPSSELRAELGNVSDMTLWRWSRDPALDFPEPIYIRKRRYWKRADIDAWKEAQAARASA